MTIKISQPDYWQLIEQTQRLDNNSSTNNTDIIRQYPQELGKGYYRKIQLREGLELAIENSQLHDDLIVECPERQHSLEFLFQISGSSSDNNVCNDAGEYFFYGSGIAPQEQCETSSKQQNLIINVHVEPELFCSFFGENISDIRKELNYLLKNEALPYLVG